MSDVIVRLADEKLEKVRGIANRLGPAQGDKNVVRGIQEELALVLGQITGASTPETLEIDLSTGDVTRVVVEEKPKKKKKAAKK